MSKDCSLVIFGATGNLAEVKLIPSLFYLDQNQLLSERLRLVCCGRKEFSQQSWRENILRILERYARQKPNEDDLQRFCNRIEYFSGDLSDGDTFERLKHLLQQPEYPHNQLFYISLPPTSYGPTISSLGEHGMLEETGPWRRVVIEKPFGHNGESAQNLQHRISHHLREEQTYRIDHYMGKAVVQNVLVSRFANMIMEPLWNRNYIDHVQISRTETLGVGSRAGFYENTGALRDMLQSHLLQMMSLVAMEPPASMDAEDLRDEKVKVLKSVRPIHPSAVSGRAFRAQYRSGEINGEKALGYREEDAVDAESVTETYALLKLYVDNWRWRGVPFYLRTGKRMAESRSTIAICFKEPPKQFFRSAKMQPPPANWLIMSIAPEEELRLEITVKEPGLEMKTRQISLDAPFRCEHDIQTDAYEGLLLDVIAGDRSQFLRFDEVEQAWRIVDPVLNLWANERDYIPTYAAGSGEPAEVNRLFDKPTHLWRQQLDPLE